MGRSAYRLLQQGSSWEDLSWKQRRRIFRDQYYWSTAGDGQKHIRVPENLVQESKAMVTGKALHFQREQQIGHPTHFARVASRAALVCGSINAEQHKSDEHIFRTANKGKHGNLSGKLYKHDASGFPALAVSSTAVSGDAMQAISTTTRGATTKRVSWADVADDADKIYHADGVCGNRKKKFDHTNGDRANGVGASFAAGSNDMCRELQDGAANLGCVRADTMGADHSESKYWAQQVADLRQENAKLFSANSELCLNIAALQNQVAALHGTLDSFAANSLDFACDDVGSATINNATSSTFDLAKVIAIERAVGDLQTSNCKYQSDISERVESIKMTLAESLEAMHQNVIANTGTLVSSLHSSVQKRIVVLQKQLDELLATGGSAAADDDEMQAPEIDAVDLWYDATPLQSLAVPATEIIAASDVSADSPASGPNLSLSMEPPTGQNGPLQNLFSSVSRGSEPKTQNSNELPGQSRGLGAAQVSDKLASAISYCKYDWLALPERQLSCYYKYFDKLTEEEQAVIKMTDDEFEEQMNRTDEEWQRKEEEDRHLLSSLYGGNFFGDSRSVDGSRSSDNVDQQEVATPLEAATAQLQVGARVTLHGLNMKQLNGLSGMIAGVCYHDRYSVLLEDGTSRKFSSTHLLPSTLKVTRGSQLQPVHPGNDATADNGDDDSEPWTS